MVSGPAIGLRMLTLPCGQPRHGGDGEEAVAAMIMSGACLIATYVDLCLLIEDVWLVGLLESELTL